MAIMEVTSIDELVNEMEKTEGPKRGGLPENGNDDDDRPLGDPPAMALPRAA